MPASYKEMKHMNKTDLQEIAKTLDHEAVKGYTQMNKDHLIEALCIAQDIPMHEQHEIVGLDKTAVKKQIRQLKKERDQALKDNKPEVFRAARRQIKELKHQLRNATV